MRALKLLLEAIGAIYLTMWFNAVQWDSRIAMALGLLGLWYIAHRGVEVFDRNRKPTETPKRRFVMFADNGDELYKWE